MAALLTPNDIDFNIQFNFENGTSKFFLTDNTSYPVDGVDYGWNIRIVSPSGQIYASPNAGLPSLSHSGTRTEALEVIVENSTWDSLDTGNLSGTVNIPQDVDGNVEQGVYSFVFFMYEPTSGTTEGLVASRSIPVNYTAAHIAPSGNPTMTYDQLTATISAADSTPYALLSINPTISRVLTLFYPTPSGLLNVLTPTSSVSVTFPDTYTGGYSADLKTTATYDFTSKYTIVYEIGGAESLSIDSSNSLSQAYSGLKTVLLRIDQEVAAGQSTQATASQAQAERIAAFLEAAYNSLATGNSEDYTDWVSKAISAANLVEGESSGDQVQLIPVATGGSSGSVVEVVGSASKGTKVTKSASGIGTLFTVALTDTANDKLNDAITDNDVDYSVTRFRNEGIPEGARGTTVTTLTAGGGTINLTPGSSDRYQVFNGSVTLSSSWTIQIDPGFSDHIDGEFFLIQYKGTITASGSDVNILGTDLTDEQMLTGNTTLLTVYDTGTAAWYTQILDGATSKRLYSNAEDVVIDTTSGKAVLKSTTVSASATDVLVKSAGNEIQTRSDFMTDGLTEHYVFVGDATNKSSEESFDSTFFRARGLSQPVYGTATTDLSSTTTGTKSLDPDTDKGYQIFTGTTSLTGNYTVSGAGTPKDGDKFVIDWRSVMTLSGNSLTIFGVVVDADLALNGFTLEAVYDGTTASYRAAVYPDLNRSAVIGTTDIVDESVTSVKVAPSAIGSDRLAINAITTTKINDASVTEVKLADASISVAKLTSTAKTEVITSTLSFETGEIGNHKIRLPYDCTVNRLDYAVVKLIEATDDGSVTAKDNAGASMAATTITGGTAIGTVVSEAGVSSNNTFTAGHLIQLETAKVTAGGKVIVSIELTRD